MFVIFGANGFFGRNVVEALVARGVQVRAVSRSFAPAFEERFRGSVDFVKATLEDPFACAEALEGAGRVLQLVSTSSPGLKNDYILEDIQNNIIPQVRFLQDCVKAGVRRVIYVSSGGTVYGRPMSLPIAETHPEMPICSHGVTKLATEKYYNLFGQCFGLENVILRVANPFGPHQRHHRGQGLIAAVFECLRLGEPIRIYGDGSARRDFIYIADVVDAILRAFESPAARGEVINIGSGQGRSVAEVVAGLEKVLGTTFNKDHVPSRSSDVDVNVLDVAKARAVLGWAPSTPFEEGLEKTVAALRKTGRLTI